jgi:ankyrin repeat protein
MVSNIYLDDGASGGISPISPARALCSGAVICGLLAGVTIATLGAVNLFGEVGSFGFYGSVIGGGVLACGGIGGIIALAITNCKNNHPISQKNDAPSSIQHQNQEQSSVSPFPFLDLPKEIAQHVLDFSNPQDIGRVGQLSQACHVTMQAAIIKRACEYGYTGSDWAEAREYIKAFIKEIKLLLSYNILAGISKETDPEKVAMNFQSIDTEYIYEIYTRLKHTIVSFELLSKYFLKLIKNKVIKPTQVAKRNDGEPPLAWAAQTGAIEATLLLLTIGADPNARAKNGALPLHFAASNGRAEIVNLLLDHGAGINECCGTTSALLAAVWCFVREDKRKPTESRRQEIVHILLKRGADPNKGDLPLHRAALLGFEGMITLLLEYGARIDDLDGKNHTPLFVAAQSRHLTKSKRKATVQLLMKHGADPASLIDLIDLL